MLRDYAYTTEELDSCLNRFKLPKDAKLVDIKLFRMLTPDSFIWKLRMTDSMYYLYAEDFVSSLADIQRLLDDFTHNQAGHLIEVKEQTAFDNLSTVKHAVVYTKPDDYDSRMIKYVTDSGPDLVFLYRIDTMSDEDKEEF